MADNIIKVNVTANKSQRVTVSSANVGTEITASSDTGKFWAQNAKNWAVSENIVDGEDYSSKYYANKSKSYAQNAESFEAATRETYDNFINLSNETTDAITGLKQTAVTEIEDIKNSSVVDINSTVDAGIADINNTKTNIITDIEFVADGEKEEILGLADEIKDSAEDIINRVSLSMFDTILKDHVLTYEESKGLALQGTYVYKEAIAGSRYGYPDFYNKCLEEYNEATDTETVNGITVKVHSNGHKFYNIADKSAIDDFFNTMGSAWFYGIDTENERVFLPRNNYFDQATANVSEVGQSVEAGLPNITGHFASTTGSIYSTDGAFTLDGTVRGQLNGSYNGSLNRGYLNASILSSVYKDDVDTVQPNAVKKLLYICVGNTVSDTSWVDVVTQVEGGVKDLEDKTNEGLSALANASNALRQTQITNCLLEVPQNIKLELTDGVLTLKAGSKVVVPNGVGVFDEVVIENDVTLTITGTNNRIICYRPSSNTLYGPTKEESGTTATLNSCAFYNTSENKIFYMDTNMVASTYLMSFPICRISTVDGIITEIKDISNGFGYIGSTIWVDKGVKGLKPNGRNADGTLNNTEIINTYVRTRTLSTTGSGDWYVAFNPNITWTSAETYSYDEEKNMTLSGGGNWGACVLGRMQFTNGVITSFKPKQPFRAIDYNDTEYIFDCMVPDYTAGVSRTHNTDYVATETCWIYLYVYSSSGSSGTHVARTIYIDDKEVAVLSVHSWNSNCCMVPCKKGSKYRITNVNTGTGGYAVKVFPVLRR